MRDIRFDTYQFTDGFVNYEIAYNLPLERWEMETDTGYIYSYDTLRETVQSCINIAVDKGFDLYDIESNIGLPLLVNDGSEISGIWIQYNHLEGVI